MVTIHLQIFNSSSLFSTLLGIVPSTTTKTGITVIALNMGKNSLTRNTVSDFITAIKTENIPTDKLVFDKILKNRSNKEVLE